jgi:(R,R)-butanediol dehydrogenase/meso-butanediol dehydrogenase/diacetyl reductase
MATMKAAVYRGDRTVPVEDVEVPGVGPGQLLLEVGYCGICGSDLHMVIEGWGAPGSVSGHEYSGVVAAVGPDVSGWAPGDRAVGGPGPGCGSCRFCTAGRTNLCAARPRSGIDPFIGAFARFKLLDAQCAYPIPDQLTLRHAALTEPLAVALAGIRKVSLTEGARVLVTGGGPIGQLTIALLGSLSEVSEIVLCEPVELRRRRGMELGATSATTPDLLTAPPLPMDVAERPFAAAFECSGHPAAMEAALDNLDRGGTLVLSGTGMRRPRFDANRIILNELVVTGTVEYTHHDYMAAIDLLAGGRLPLDDLIEPGEFGLDDVESAMDRLSRGELAGKVLVRPGILRPEDR